MNDKIITKTLTLTLEQLFEIEDCMIIAKERCKREREVWAKASLEKNPDGTPTYKNAKSNAEYFDEKISKINEIMKML